MQTTFLTKSTRGISVYELTNDNGMRVQVLDYGARLHAMYVPSLAGSINVLAGFDDPDGYLGENPYFNAVVGRVANRIEDSRFTLDGVTYHLASNFGPHHLHGGLVGFDRRMWRVIMAEGGAISLQYVSPDGEENYPGTVTVTVTYRLTEDNTLHLDYTATTDRATPLNLTNHAYFNLDGDFRTVRGHRVWIDSDTVLPSDELFVVRGERLAVEGTIYDFRTPKAIGTDLPPADAPHVVGEGGYDISYVLSAHDPDAVVATAMAEHSGIRMSVRTDRPCLQFYSGNFLDGVVGRCVYDYQTAFCMETQDYSNAPNVPDFPSVILRPGDTYRAHTSYSFDVQD